MDEVIVKETNDFEDMGSDDYCANHNYYKYKWTELSDGRKHGIFKQTEIDGDGTMHTSIRSLYSYDVKVWTIEKIINYDAPPDFINRIGTKTIIYTNHLTDTTQTFVCPYYKECKYGPSRYNQ